MMISPESYRSMYIDKPMLSLKFEKMRLTKIIQSYEKGNHKIQKVKRSPSPTVVYNMSKEYLNVINAIINNRRKRRLLSDERN